MRDGLKLCYNCFQKQVSEETRLWQEEQRRNIGPEWDGVPTKKLIKFKRPISIAPKTFESSSSSSSSLTVCSNLATAVVSSTSSCLTVCSNRVTEVVINQSVSSEKLPGTF